MSYKDKIKSKEELIKAVDAHKANKEVVVHCSGCFDVLHPGHIRYLEFAKKQGDKLVVSVTADKFITKGDDRPYMPQELRLNSIAALEIVDHVYLDYDSWAGPILEIIKPDIYVKGKEYQYVTKGNFFDERSIVEGYGGEVRFSSGDVVFSSTKLINNFKKKFALDYEIFDVFFNRNKINLERMQSIVTAFQGKRIAVIGEVMLDEYNYCDVVDVSSEAPVLTIKSIDKKQFIGGAGIIAKHIKSLGGEPVLFSVVGKDYTAEIIKDDLEREDIKNVLVEKKDITTIKKSRYIASKQKLLKVDESNVFTLSELENGLMIEKIKSEAQKFDVVIFADFAYGLINENIRTEIVEFCNNHKIPVIADVSGTMGGDILRYKDVDLIAPTEKEARKSLDDKTSGLANVAYKLMELTNSKNILITMGENGLLLFKNSTFSVRGKEDQHLESEFIPAINKHAIDAMGAGDSMISIIALGLAGGATYPEATFLGSIASSIEVGKEGNIPIPYEEFVSELQNIVTKKG